MPSIVIAQGQWPETDAPSLYAVLNRTLDDFQVATGATFTRDILAIRQTDNPIALYQEGPNRSAIIGLTAGGNHWSQFIYQFAHELCHVHANFNGPHCNPSFKWLEETFCEMASWAVLKESARSWASKPPFTNWRAYANAIREYRKTVMQGARACVPLTDFRPWFFSELPKLSANSCLREPNARVGIELWPIFDDSPAAWAAVALLNTWESRSAIDLPAYLNQWRQHARAREAKIVEGIQRVLCGST